MNRSMRIRINTTSLRLLCLLILAAGLSLFPTSAQAKSSLVYKTGFGKNPISFNLDLDGDGKKEKVTASVKYDIYTYAGETYDNGIDYIKISVTDNGKTVTTTLKDKNIRYRDRADLAVVTLDSKHVYLNISVDGPNDYTDFNKLYKYNSKSGKLSSVKNLLRSEATISSCTISSVTSDCIVVTYYCQPATTGRLNFNLTYILKNGTFRLKSATVSANSVLGSCTYPGDGMEKYYAKNQFKTCKKLTFYKKAGDTAKAFTVASKKFVTLKKLKLYKGNIYGQFQYNGSLGWRKITVNPYDYSKEDVDKTGWFYGVYHRLAG